MLYHKDVLKERTKNRSDALMSRETRGEQK